jgi:aminobenzoyl-glutamate transport protein
MTDSQEKAGSNKKGRLIARGLAVIERVGNALPHPAVLFASMAAFVVVASGIFSWIGIKAVHPGTGETIVPLSLLSVEGLHRILTEMITNFTGFAPLAPRSLLTFVIVFAGILSNTASEVGYVLLVPLGGMIFLAVGRHPIAGIAAAFAGVSGGYSANLLLGTIDPLLAGLTEEAARIIDPAYTVNPACNYYFLVASTFFIATVGTWVTERIVIPRLGKYTGEEVPEKLESLSGDEKRGLLYASVAAAVFTALLLWGTLPADGFLRNPETGSLLRSPFLSGIVAVLFISSAVTGIAYGYGARTFRKDSDVIEGMSKSMQTLGLYIVLVFFAAQFVAYFKWSNIGLIFAINGAEVLKASGLGSIPLMIAFVFISALVNLAMGSASAKWAIMAPVFVPMFMLLGYSPELVQGTYRVGDSITNVISPLMSYFPLVVAFLKRYDDKAGIGTVVATMLPYSVAFFIVWTLLLIVWFLMGFPMGPGSPLMLGG